MATSHGNKLAHNVREKVEELRRACEGVDENTASRAPSGRWSPKEILSHLCGPDGVGLMPLLKAFIERENPTLEIEVENPFFTEARAKLSFAQLVTQCCGEYERIARFATELNEEQLERTAHIPQFAGTPLGEHPTLASVINGLGQFHLGSHTEHLREILKELSEQPV